MDPLLAPDDDDVSELLALIDELYAPPRTSGARETRKRRRHAAARRQELLAQIEELQSHLDAMRQGLEPNDSIDAAQLWAPVALRQRKQRRAVEHENAALRSVARGHRELMRCITTALEELQSTVVYTPPKIVVLFEPGPSSPIPTLFVKLLDAVCERVGARAIEVTDDYTCDLETGWNDTHTALRYRVRKTARYPFQLSSVVDEFWRAFHEQTPGTTLAHDEVYHASTTFYWRKPSGWFEVQGPSAVRRVYTQDGGVLLVSVAVMAGTKSDHDENLMAGLELHETVTVRLLRTDALNPRSPVFVESVSESEVVATPGADGALHGDRSRAHLERILSFIATSTATEDRGEGRQKLENRLLDASLSRGRATSPQSTA